MRHAVLPSALLALSAIAAAAALLAGPARAQGVPSPANSTTPACVSLVGSDGTTPARTFGEFEVIFRDLANNPMPGVLIHVDFSEIPELGVSPVQLDPGLIVDCAGKRVSKLTDANGRAVFCILGAGTGVPPVTRLSGCSIFAAGTLIARPTASAYDLDGQLGLGAGDLVEWLSDFVLGVNYGRSDYDCSGALGAGDLALWLTAYGSGSQPVSASVGCP